MSAVPNGHESAANVTDAVAANADSSPSHDEVESKQNEKGDDSVVSKAKESGDEVVVIQDTGFTISIVSPGVEPFDLPVSCFTSVV